MITITQFITIVFATIILSLSYYRYRRTHFNLQGFFLWSLVSIVFFISVIFLDDVSNFVVDILGLEIQSVITVMDFFLYVGILILFTIIFFMYAEINKIQVQLSNLVSKIAIDKFNEKK